MKKWKCVDNNGCPSKCEFETTSIGKPDFCPIDGHSARWEESEKEAGETFYFCDEVEEAKEKIKQVMNEREESVTNCNQLPDWCKVGDWCYYSARYLKITDIKNGGVYAKEKEEDSPLWLSFDTFKKVAKPVRLRMWTPEEAIGKVIMEAKCYYIISAADEYTALIGNTFIKMYELLNRFKQPDGSPCGVMEHLEDGEWRS